ncbi:MAG: alpha/beta hydrolase [Rubrivivax sp.]|nr:MAG: alpha/beta hydrolase [Rubrivivax sp.]
MNYAVDTYWRQYQAFFPARFRVTSSNAPEEEWFKTRSLRIHLDRFKGRDSLPTIVLIHGGGGYGRLFAPVGLMLAAHGYEVVAPDLPGYGLSKAPASAIDYEAWVGVLRDLVLSERRRSGRPVILFGGSLGGYLAYLCAASLDSTTVAGVIATTLADPRLAVTQKQFARNAFLYSVGLPILKNLPQWLGRVRLPLKWLTKMHKMSRSPGMVELVVKDPRGGGVRMPLNFMRSIFTTAPAQEPEAFDVCPVLLVHPEKDGWTDVATSQHFLERLRVEKSLVLLQDCGHFPLEEPGLTQMERAVLQFIGSVASVKTRFEQTLPGLGDQ